VNIDQLNAGHGGAGEYRAGNCIGNIVKFQVQEDSGAECGNLVNGLRASGGKELAADLEHAHKIGNLPCKFQSG
jgi:hypothetical protein